MNNVSFVKTRIDLERKHFPQGVAPDAIRLLDDVEQLLSKAYQAGLKAAEQSAPQPWSNQSCFGYAIMAAERIGMGEKEIQRLVRAMHNRFDMITLAEAAEHYRKSPY
ncbi:hypothetical protein P9314_17955 [Paenibacillus validus]|uniref:hypothetical protein n=1 Tax=Paenibacillus validus TaxID=44253 RepID=UPI000FD77C99|nr:hypothetical protein [Paenibacillus validus]MED4602553.1 hypothetical protein [Paenibacillus validus]MED4606078.1 hypothetical protein [Paenibacillus validus]